MNRAEMGARIAAARKATGMSQRQLADAIGGDQTAMSRIESGLQGTTVDTLVLIAASVGVTAASLIGEEEGAASPLDVQLVRQQRLILMALHDVTVRTKAIQDDLDRGAA